MSDLLRTACNEARKGNSTVKQQVRDIGNKFLNNVEISVQEAVYIVLQLAMRNLHVKLCLLTLVHQKKEFNC